MNGPSEINQKLDRVATVLIAAVAAVSAAFALFGVSSERVWTLLDDDDVAPFILASAVLAVAAVGLSLVSYLLPARRNALEAALLGLGLTAYVTSLVVAMWASASAADTPGRPSITEVALTHANGEQTLSFTARADSVDPNQRLGVRVTIDGSAAIYESTLRPTPGGTAELTATVPVDGLAGSLEIAAWRLDDGAEPDCGLPAMDRRAGCVRISS